METKLVAHLFLEEVKTKLTAADHAWQNSYPRPGVRHFNTGDACGFWFKTKGGTIWVPSDSKLMPEQLKLPAPNLIFWIIRKVPNGTLA